MSNIVAFVKNQVSSTVIDKLHSFLGIPEEKIQRGLDAIIPSVVGAISDHANKENQGLLDLLKPFMGDDFDFSNMASQGGGLTDLLQAGHTLLAGLFGSELSDAVKSVAKEAALEDHVAGKLMRLSAPGVVSGVVEGLSPDAGLAELKSVLSGHLGALGVAAGTVAGATVAVGSAVAPTLDDAGADVSTESSANAAEVATAASISKSPGPLRITVGDTAEVEKAHAPVVETPKIEPVKAAAASPIASTISGSATGSSTPSSSYGTSGGDQKATVLAGFALMLVLLGAAAYFGLFMIPADIEKDRASAKAKEAAMESTNEVPAANAPASDVKREPVEGAKAGDIQVEIDGGVKLNAAKDGIEYKLVDFIKSSKPVDKTTWFSFDRLYFDTAKATLKPESKFQLENITAIMKAYPNVKLKIGGYTDNQGNDAINLKISSERANVTMVKLIEMGVAKDRLEAEGYGKQYPVASNDTEEGRAKNRRIDVRVTAK
jgi:OmpA-OmpF porin, OOP family